MNAQTLVAKVWSFANALRGPLGAASLGLPIDAKGATTEALLARNAVEGQGAALARFRSVAKALAGGLED